MISTGSTDLLQGRKSTMKEEVWMTDKSEAVTQANPSNDGSILD